MYPHSNDLRAGTEPVIINCKTKNVKVEIKIFSLKK